MKVVLVPMGDVPPDLLTGLSDALRTYGFRCEVSAAVSVPADAFDPHRAKYNAEGLLGRLSVRARAPVLAVTSVDLFAGGLNFVFGLANMGRPGALVSVHRLHTADRALLLERLVKESVHELGHTLGLQHCANEGCVMRFSNSLQEADAKGRSFCDSCRGALPVATGPVRA